MLAKLSSKPTIIKNLLEKKGRTDLRECQLKLDAKKLV